MVDPKLRKFIMRWIGARQARKFDVGYARDQGITSVPVHSVNQHESFQHALSSLTYKRSPIIGLLQAKARLIMKFFLKIGQFRFGVSVEF